MCCVVVIDKDWKRSAAQLGLDDYMMMTKRCCSGALAYNVGSAAAGDLMIGADDDDQDDNEDDHDQLRQTNLSSDTTTGRE